MAVPTTSQQEVAARMPPGTTILLRDETEIALFPTPSDDPDDPLNWSKFRKYLNMTFLLAQTCAGFTAVTMQIVFWQQMTVDPGIDLLMLSYANAASTAGLAIGCILISPLTRKYGCRSTYILSTAVMAAMSWWSARMQTDADCVITNLGYGIAMSLNETLSQITIADLFFVHQRGAANGLYIIASMLGNLVFPIFAGLQAASQGWRWTYYTAAIVLTALTLLMIPFLEETKYIPVSTAVSSPNKQPLSSEEHHSSRSDKGQTTEETPVQETAQDVEFQSAPSKQSPWGRLRFITKTDEPLWRNYVAPFVTAQFPYVLYTALQVSAALVFIVFLTSANSIVFSAPPYSFDTAGVGLLLLGPFIGSVLGSLYGGILGDRVSIWLAKRNNGVFEPEMRLYILPFAALCSGAGLILYGIGGGRGWHWIYPSIGGALWGFATAATMDVACTVTIDVHRELTSEAFSFITLLRNAPAAGFTFGIVNWLERLGMEKLFIICGCVSTAVCLTCVPFMIWGRRIREAIAPANERMINRYSMAARG